MNQLTTCGEQPVTILISNMTLINLLRKFSKVYIHFNFDFLDLHNVFFENYFANELTSRSFLKQFKTFALGVLSGLKILDFASLLLIF
jgi:hypothetical protein